jgi:hypothetical protein
VSGIKSGELPSTSISRLHSKGQYNIVCKQSPMIDDCDGSSLTSHVFYFGAEYLWEGRLGTVKINRLIGSYKKCKNIVLDLKLISTVMRTQTRCRKDTEIIKSAYPRCPQRIK